MKCCGGDYSYYYDTRGRSSRRTIDHDLEGRRRTKHIRQIDPDTLEAFAVHHLAKKDAAGNVTRRWLKETKIRLLRAVRFFGAGRELDQIRPKDVREWADALREQKGGRRGNATLSEQAVRHHLNALSNLYKRAIEEERVPPGFNPVAQLLDKPTVTRREARWLEVPDAALYLEAARCYQPSREKRTLPFAYALVATFLLTGGREAEVLGLEVDDLSFRRRTITFRPNDWRPLKNQGSHRPVPLWPQLEEILRDYIAERERSGGLGRLLFPSPRLSYERMVSDTRKTLDGIAERGGWAEGEIRTKMFRHTYCAARLQTLDGGAPISPFTVARELGHRLLTARAPRQFSRCQGTTSTGEPCKERTGLSTEGFCIWHDPKRREQARQARSSRRSP